jgi:cytochrome P450
MLSACQWVVGSFGRVSYFGTPGSVTMGRRCAVSPVNLLCSTTAGMTSWHLLHISMHPEVQERIRELSALESTDGVMTADTVSHKSVPYLHAAFRESHRITNPSPLVPMKRIQMDVTIHGVDIPAGNVIIFDGISKSHNLVENPDKFEPDRWLPDAVEARKGTTAAELDHVLFKAPFSEGARRCPGSRVAKNESLLLMAQLILDWKMENPVEHWRDVKYRMDTLLTPMLPKIEFIARS